MKLRQKGTIVFHSLRAALLCPKHGAINIAIALPYAISATRTRAQHTSRNACRADAHPYVIRTVAPGRGGEGPPRVSQNRDGPGVGPHGPRGRASPDPSLPQVGRHGPRWGGSGGGGSGGGGRRRAAAGDGGRRWGAAAGGGRQPVGGSQWAAASGRQAVGGDRQDLTWRFRARGSGPADIAAHCFLTVLVHSLPNSELLLVRELPDADFD